MSVEDTVVETERVIVAVGARPVLWDATHEFYKSRETRQNAWKELCRELVHGFDDYDSTERKAIEAKIQQRWRTARDCYVKTKSSQYLRPDGSKRTKAYEYVHCNILTFLDRTMRLPATTPHTSPPAPTPTSCEGTPLYNRIKLNKFRRVQPPMKNIKRGNLKVQRRGDVKLGRRTDAIVNVSRKSDVMSEFEKQLLQCLRKDTSPLDLDDSDFFKSLAPILKGFSSNQKLLFRSKVIEIAMTMQASQGFEGEPNSPSQMGGEKYMDTASVYHHEESDHSPSEEEKFCPF